MGDRSETDGIMTATTVAGYAPERVCRKCGCTEHDACVVTEAPERAWNQPGQVCWWIEENLCSACTDRVDPRLTWRHGGDRHQCQGLPPLTVREKLAFGWVAIAMALGSLSLVGLIG